MMSGGYFAPGFAERLEAKIIEETNEKLIDVGNDICTDFPAYRYACGMIAGLRRTIAIMDELKKEMEQGTPNVR